LDVRRPDGGGSCFDPGFALWSPRRVCGEKGLVVCDRAFNQPPEPVGGMFASGQQRGSEISTINITMLASRQLRLFPANRGEIGGGSEKLLDEGFAETLDKRPVVVRGDGGMVAALRRITPLLLFASPVKLLSSSRRTLATTDILCWNIYLPKER
jgi:hypothetical protein